jgi:hypothetical protein
LGRQRLIREGGIAGAVDQSLEQARGVIHEGG